MLMYFLFSVSQTKKHIFQYYLRTFLYQCYYAFICYYNFLIVIYYNNNMDNNYLIVHLKNLMYPVTLIIFIYKDVYFLI